MRLSRNVRRFSQPLSITSCSEKLIQNDPGFVELSLERLGENFDLGEFVFAIQANHTVRHVCFSGTFVRELNPSQWRAMLEAVGYLEALEELQVWCSSIPVDVLSHTIHSAILLQKVYFFRVTFDGDQADYVSLARSIRDHPSLRDFRIGGFQTSEHVSMDPVLEGLAEAPALEVVSLQLTGVNERAPFSGVALAKLLRSSTITDLYLSRLGLSQDHLVVVALSLLANKTLRTLDLFGNSVENDHVIMIANALQTNTRLETLVLPCPSDDLSMECCSAITQALQINKTLVTLNLPRSVLSDDGLSQFAHALTVNTTLKKIEVGVSKNLGDKGTVALIEMLEKNYQLERLVVSSAEQGIREKVEYYMRLNDVGRGTLLRDGNATREQWVEMLISVIDDLDCLFYFISRNPTLCQFVNVSRAAVIVTEEFKPMRRHTLDPYALRCDMDRNKRVENRRASAF